MEPKKAMHTHPARVSIMTALFLVAQEEFRSRNCFEHYIGIIEIVGLVQ